MSIHNLGAMYLQGIGTEQDVPKAKELFMKAAALGNVGAILAFKDIDKAEGNTTPSFTVTRTSCSFCGVAHAPPDIKVNPCTTFWDVYVVIAMSTISMTTLVCCFCCWMRCKTDDFEDVRPITNNMGMNLQSTERGASLANIQKFPKFYYFFVNV